jgi:energy-converting hydrogenase A subunit M
MKNLNDTDMETLDLRFRGAFEAEEKIEQQKAVIKEFKASQTDLFKAIAKDLECSVKSVKEAWRQYLFTKTQPSVSEDTNSILVVMQTIDK